MKRVFALSAVLAIGFASAVYACDKEVAAAVAKAKGGCCPKALNQAVAKVMDTLPAMQYRVGDMTTPCVKTATAKADSAHPIKYVVGDETFGTEGEAVAALAAKLEKMATDMSEIHFAVGNQVYHCPMSAKAACKDGQQVKYQLAGFEFDSMDKAEAALKKMQAYMETKQTLAGAETTATEGDKPKCNKPCDKPCGKQAQVAAAQETPPCHKGKVEKAAAEGEKQPCSKGKTVNLAGDQKPCDKPCGKAKNAKVAGAGDTPSCCKKAQERVASVRDNIREMVEVVAALSMAS